MHTRGGQNAFTSEGKEYIHTQGDEMRSHPGEEMHSHPEGNKVGFLPENGKSSRAHVF